MTNSGSGSADTSQESRLWVEHEGPAPIMATAVHSGHAVRRELLPLLALDDAERSREEDVYTDYWAKVVPTWLVPTHSRFEVDLNRARDEAVYESAEMAWGLDLWAQGPSEESIERSLVEYDEFYSELERILDALAEQFGCFVVLDLHSYNHRRGGPQALAADEEENPEVNVGTGSLDRARYAPLVDRFMTDLRSYDFLGRSLDVRENVKFTGRHLARWVHERYGAAGCVLSVEFKKFFMDEWTGVGNVEQITAVRDALQSTVPGLLEELAMICEAPDDR